MDLVLSCYLPVNNIKHSLWFVGLEEILTPKEKILLYEAIGYSETAVDPTLPKTVKMFCCLIPEYLLIDSPNFNPFRNTSYWCVRWSYFESVNTAFVLVSVVGIKFLMLCGFLKNFMLCLILVYV